MSTKFASIWEQAEAAGRQAVANATVEPIVVQDNHTGKSWLIEDGLCGFAWVQFAGNTAFGRWAKANGLARKGYPNGLQHWIRGYGQSVAKKEAYAQAFASILQQNGIQAYSGSRLD